MRIIEFEKLVNELSDESFAELKARTGDYFSYYYVDDLTKIDKVFFLEKLGEYLKQFVRNNLLMSDKRFISTYYDELNSLIRDRTVPVSKADEFYDKAKKLFNSVDTVEGNNFYTNIEDYTKIFLTIYNEFLKNREKVSQISFLINDIDYDALTRSFIDDKPEMNKDLKRLKNKVENIAPKVLKEVVNDARDGVQSLINKANTKLALRNEKKKEKDFELFKSIIDEEKDEKHHSKRVFSLILMTIVYLRLKDFELGL